MKKIFLTLIFIFSTTYTFALTPLPRYAYLQLGDNQREVVLLQQILNSDPDTQIASDGVGSPGQENWYFGKLTEAALKKFQAKYKLDTTGRIDYKTWNALNNYINNQSPTSTTPSRTIPDKQQPTSPATYSAPSKPTEAKASTTPITGNNLLDSILSKYSSLFSNFGTSGANSAYLVSSPTYSAQTPYYNSATGQYQSSQPAISGSAPVSSSAGGLSPYSNSNNFGNPYSQYLPYSGQNNGQQSYQGPPIEGVRWNGDGNGNGFGETLTTVYGHERNGSPDKGDNGQPFCQSSCSTRKGGPCEKVVSLKGSVIRKIFGINPGSTSENTKDLYAAKNKFCKTEIEVVYPQKKTCGVYVLFEVGPKETLPQSMDLTGTAWNQLDPGGNSGKAKMQFRILKPGDQACQGYTRVDGK
jgi:hypothetical protein